MRVLVAGGAGFIGSHTCVSLAAAGHEPVVLDNFCNASPGAVERVSRIIGRALPLVRADVRDVESVREALVGNGIDAVVHFAALKSVAAGVADPLAYMENNVGGTVALLRAMALAGVGRLVFSSTAMVYSTQGGIMPLSESSPLGASNPYGRTKLMAEQVISDQCVANPGMSALLLRYFNPVGAHPSGLIGEDPRGVPDNLMPYIAQVAVGRRDRLRVFGADWPTHDGTGVRDYLHVMDLAQAHVRAVEALESGASGAKALNLGTGRGTTVLELVRSFESASGRRIPYEIVGRRAGDVAELWADARSAKEHLGWEAVLGLERMCEDAWRWQRANPDGYESTPPVVDQAGIQG